ncbi:hypothetical protein B0H19DRAFT_1154327 [Mycena capillaripes]|nr:hypothetical protein B0H19DRAFT_1154327 [Mycena capillaripes]
MSIPLTPRGQCTQCPSCAGWIALAWDPQERANVPRDTPTSSAQECAGCTHAWLSHHAYPMDSNDRNYSRRRGPCTSTRCGGFISCARVWEVNTLCECTAQWYSHSPLRNGVSSAISVQAPAPILVPSAPAQPADNLPPLGPGQPVMDGFLGVPATVRGTAGTRRLASISRSLPGGPFSTLRNHSGPRRPFPPPADPKVTIDVVCWPCTVDTLFDPPGYPSHAFKIKNSHAIKYAKRLADFHLAFQIEVPAQGVMSSAEFSRTALQHLGNHRLTLPPFPADYDAGPADELDGQLWTLLHFRRRYDVYILEAHPSIQDSTFGYAQFKKISTMPNVLPGANQRPWIFIAPRFGHLIGPMDCFSTPDAPLSGCHPCYGLRVLSALPTTTGNRNNPLEAECYVDYCPTPSITPIQSLLAHLPLPAGRIPDRPQTPPLQPSLIRHRSPQTPNTTSAERRVRQRRSSSSIRHPIGIDQWLPETPAEPASPPPPPPPRPPLPPLEPDVDFLESRDILSWHLSISNAVQPFPASVAMLTIHARTVHAAAECMVDLVVHAENVKRGSTAAFTMYTREIQNQDIVHCNTRLTADSFFRDIRLITIGIREGSGHARGITHGVGPERATMREACVVIASRHHYWQQATGSFMFRPVLTPVDTPIEERIRTFYAHGTFLAVHCFLLKQGPLPISLWLLLALVNGRKAMIIPKHILMNLDPGAYDILAPWYDFHSDTPVPLPREATHPLRQFILERMPQEIQPNLIRNDRTVDEHEAWVISAFASVLLGHHSPWTHPEFIALRDGFNIGIKSTRFADTIRRRRALPFFVALYNLRIKTVADIAPHLHFQILTRAANKTTPFFMKLFQLRLEHYLDGLGHPAALRGVQVSEEEYEGKRNDPLLRANLVLVSGSDSDLLPIEDNWRILFRFQAKDITDSILGKPLGFHTCFHSVDVLLDRNLREMLLEPLDDNLGQPSKFDVWVHSQFLNREHNTS